jgi:vancomycin resistance protein VanJ
MEVQPKTDRPIQSCLNTRAVISVICWLYAILTLTLWAFLRLEGDRWWPATMILFGPKWFWGVPLAVLFPAALWRSRRSMWLLLSAGVVLLVPVMGFCIPRPQLTSASVHDVHTRIVTCNIHGDASSFVALSKLIADQNPDIVALQEWSERDAMLFENSRWHVHRDGELFLATRFPILSTKDLSQGHWPGTGSVEVYDIDTAIGQIHIINARLASPHQQFADLIHRSPDAPAEVDANSLMRRQQAEMISSYVQTLHGPVIIVGDFNTPCDSAVFRESFSGFTDAFSVRGFGLGNTYHARWTRVRIDHVIFNADGHCEMCRTGPNVGSPHRPVIADLKWALP